MAQLGIEHIASYSAEGRGRMERLFGTLQKRLPPLVRLAGLTTVAAANRWLREVYRAEHNTRFAVEPAEAASAFVRCRRPRRDPAHPAGAHRGSRQQPCATAARVLQIPDQAHRCHFVKATVRVHEHPDGTLALFHGPRLLARYGPDGAPVTTEPTTRSAA